MKDAYYFSHDNNARNDIKIRAMMTKYGYEGYGIFWALIEMMHESGAGELPLEDYLYMAIQREFNGCSTDVKQFINDCITIFKLFETDGEKFWSNSLKRRMEMHKKRREQARVAGKRSAEIRKLQALETDVQRTFNDRSTESNKGKERKGKEIIYRKIQHLTLTTQEYEKLVEAHGKAAVEDILDQMENYAKLKNYKSAYLTANNWLKRRKKPKPPEPEEFDPVAYEQYALRKVGEL